MTGTKKIFYWDSCIFISWIKNEDRKDPNDMAGVRDVIDRLKKRDVTIITSTITQTEVGACNVGVGVLQIFDDLLKRKNIQRISVDIKIAQLARTLRDHYRNCPAELDADGKLISPKTLSVPDAIHLATAILNKVDCFHTFDKNNSKESLGLLPLTENIAGHGLKI